MSAIVHITVCERGENLLASDIEFQINICNKPVVLKSSVTSCFIVYVGLCCVTITWANGHRASDTVPLEQLNDSTAEICSYSANHNNTKVTYASDKFFKTIYMIKLNQRTELITLV